MIPPQEMLSHITAEQFAPFRIHTARGRVFEVRHPEFVQIGRSTLTVYSPPDNAPDGPQRWEKVSLVLVESIAPLAAPLATRNS